MININKELIYKDLIIKIKTIQSNKIASKIEIKDTLINNMHEIENALEKCIHDKYSDIDIQITIKNSLNIHLRDLGIETENILGIKLEKNNDCYVIRMIQKDGIKYDIILFATNIKNVENEINMINKEELFIAILSLSKLMRNDYLISAHLAHMLCMNSLVEQMIDRDIKYGTDFHRYGYKENLNYYNTYKNIQNKYCDSHNDIYNHIAKLLISGIENIKNIANEDKKIFYEIWDFYLN